MESPIVIIGSRTAGLTLSVRHRTHPGDTDYWDGNWLSVTIDIAIGGFRGRVDADLRAEEFIAFHRDLTSLQASATRDATFTTMEEWISLQFNRDHKGHVECGGWVCDQPGTGNRLTFNLQLDQTYLPNILRDVSAVIEAYPVLGKP